MKVFVTGGAKNGKTTFAQNWAKERADKTGRKLYYIATMIPVDEEDRARIDRHRKDREGLGFETIEKGEDLADIQACGVFIVDSVTALLANKMFRGSDFVPEAGKLVADDLEKFLDAAGDAIIVSDFIYNDMKTGSETVEAYRSALAGIDRHLAEICDCVVEMVAGIPVYHKGAGGVPVYHKCAKGESE